MTLLWEKARRAAKTARANLEMGDVNAAANRAYYAMFDVARAVLMEIDPQLARAKRHATILNRFSQHMVRERGLDPELGRRSTRLSRRACSRTTMWRRRSPPRTHAPF